MRTTPHTARRSGSPLDDPETTLLDVEAWEAPIRLSRHACLDQTGRKGLRAPFNLDDKDDDR